MKIQNTIEMTQEKEFSFGDNSVAKAYDNILVPALFDPWAKHLIANIDFIKNKNILDLATGTGIISKHLANNLGKEGHITAVDINKEMLTIAKDNCAEYSDKITFIEASAESINLNSEIIDQVVCQQGFQFFSNKNKAAQEIKRVLKPKGSIYISTWKPVNECQFFGAICTTLESMYEYSISNMMRIPFDFMDKKSLANPFIESGFINIVVKEEKMEFKIINNLSEAIELAYATPIGPKLKEFSKDKKVFFKNKLLQEVRKLSEKENTFGEMKTLVLTASK